MNHAIDSAVKVFGGASALAKAIGVTPPAITEWRSGRRPVPIERCTQIEQATAGAVRRWHLRPDDWARIWPELIGAEGAPPVPADVREVA